MNGTEPLVRRGRFADASAILALAARFAETRVEWRTYDEVIAGTERALRAALESASADHAIFVAEENGAFAGFVFVDSETDFFTGAQHAHISEIAVVRDGSGCGRSLMVAAEAWAAERGSRYVSLHVTAKNARARALYERLGYQLEHSRLIKLF